MNTLTRKKSEPLKLIIIGGGYAGLSALITLRRQAAYAEITLIDPRPYHLIITRLHETVHRPLNTLQVPYSLYPNALILSISNRQSTSMNNNLRPGIRKKISSLGKKSCPSIIC